jgi:hypothetical protein
MDSLLWKGEKRDERKVAIGHGVWSVVVSLWWYRSASSAIANCHSSSDCSRDEYIVASAATDGYIAACAATDPHTTARATTYEYFAACRDADASIGRTECADVDLGPGYSLGD